VRRLLAHPSACIGGTAILVLILAAVFAPLLSPYDPLEQHLSDARAPVSLSHLLGTDQLGRDELSRLLYGARYSLAIAVVAVLTGVAIGVPAGAVSGYFGGLLDMLLQRIVDILLSFPGILLALLLAAGLGPGIVDVTVAVGVSSTPSFIRIARASALSLRQFAFVESARAIGADDRRILSRHIIPNSIGPVVVAGTLQLGSAILVASGLGFLGLGVPAPTPEWGSMLGEGRNLIFSYPTLTVFPGVTIALAVLSFNLLGDGLLDVLDPRTRRLTD
jgi:ABC-type dipeptide/oligopeptide/nickel transport system permease subunit